MNIYPWQTQLWKQLAAQPERLPHALLLEGPSGLGKRDFARVFAAALLCERRLAEFGSCGRCPSCHWFRQSTHPDFRLLEPLGEEAIDEEGGQATRKKREITVAQVRALADFVNLSTVAGGLGVVLISPAEALNPAAANALLKTLEEPAPGTHFVLIADYPHRLLPTIKSRCHRLTAPRPDAATAVAWLQSQGIKDAALCLALAGGAPLKAQACADPAYLRERQQFLNALAEPERVNWLKLAEESAKAELVPRFEWLQTWLYDLIAMRLTGRARYNLDFESRLQELGARAKLSCMQKYAQELSGAKRHLQHPLNTQLLLEDLLLGYRIATHP